MIVSEHDSYSYFIIHTRSSRTRIILVLVLVSYQCAKESLGTRSSGYVPGAFSFIRPLVWPFFISLPCAGTQGCPSSTQ